MGSKKEGNAGHMKPYWIMENVHKVIICHERQANQSKHEIYISLSENYNESYDKSSYEFSNLLSVFWRGQEATVSRQGNMNT